jgi:hypothetical protein
MGSMLHPAIVPATDFFQEKGRYFLIMRFIEGKSLKQLLEANAVLGPDGKMHAQPLPVPFACSIAIEILDALDFVHRSLIIHRDVKPSNILIEPSGKAYLTDFGIALAVGQQRLTTKGIIGTLHYMSPEQFTNTPPPDHRTDVYSFGCVMYEMLTGRPPFEETTQTEEEQLSEIHGKHVNQIPLPVSDMNPRVSPELEEIVMRSLAKDPKDRFAGCGAFATAIRALSKEPGPKEQTGSRERSEPHPEPGPPPRPPRPPVAPIDAGLFISAGVALRLMVMLGLLTVSFAPAAVANMQLQKTFGYWALLWLAAGIAAGCLHFRVLYRGWAAIRDEFTPVGPAEAVWKMLIPFYNLIWMFTAYSKMPEEYLRFAERNGVVDRLAAWSSAGAYPLLLIVQAVAWFLPAPVPALSLGAVLVVDALWCHSVCRMVNSLAVAEAPEAIGSVGAQA